MQMRMSSLSALLWMVFVYPIAAEINSSSDLNCDFSNSCMWRNGTNGQEDSGEFVPGTTLQMDEYHKITALRPDQDDTFVYSSAFGGRQTALLISDVINCQLGGASLKYWYWKTGSDVLLDVCIRQPPGSREQTNLKCYDGLSSTHGQQWIYRSVELPPISQPFEIVLRTTFTAPLNLLALDDIIYDAILCEVRHGGSEKLSVGEQVDSIYRLKRGSPPTIAYRDWQLLKKTGHLQGQTMIVVAGNESERAEESDGTTSTLTVTTTTSSTSLPPTTTSDISSTTETSPETSTLIDSTTESDVEMLQNSTLTEEVHLFTTETTSSTSSSVSTTTLSQEQHMANMMMLLRGVAPVLPYVPTLVRSLQSLDPLAAAVSPPLGVRAHAAPTLGGVHPIVPINSSPSLTPTTPDHTANLALLARQFGLLSDGEDGIELGKTVTNPESSAFVVASEPAIELPAEGVMNNDIKAPGPATNAFGIGRTDQNAVSAVPKSEYSTIYPPKIKKLGGSSKHLPMQQIHKLPSEPSPEVRRAVEDEGLDLSELSPDEIRQLEEIHRKIFGHKTTTPEPLVVFKKIPKPSVRPLQSTSNVRLKETPQKPASSGSVSPNMLAKFKEIAAKLPADQVQELAMLRDIPNLEELTAGMDISLIHKPGGFSRLKEQFIERLARRYMGLPPLTLREDTPLPPPPLPITIPKRLLKQLIAKSLRAKKH